jgi:hypothetical protein
MGETQLIFLGLLAANKTDVISVMYQGTKMLLPKTKPVAPTSQ